MTHRIHTQLIGQPQTITDAKGEWRSAIFRQAVTGPIELTLRGFVGDQVADTEHHGSPDQAVCAQPLEHYTFWNAFFGAKLEAGAVGENWTVTDVDEAAICVGDVFTVGTARVQVSAPRYPCSKQERKVQLAGFLKQVIKTKRTGWYLRVLTPGIVQAGDVFTLTERPQPETTIAELNEVVFGPSLDLMLAEKHLAIPELATGWKRILEHKINPRQDI
jgi:MOSC domain-containing protein YiiM